MCSTNSIETPFLGPKKPVSCEKCGVTFVYKKSLYAHMRKFHPEEEIVISNNQVCGLCNETFRLIGNLHEHLENKHSIELKFLSKPFYSEDDFLKWKERIEKESQSSFVLRNSSEKIGVKFLYYVCHRSGFPNLKSNRSRHKTSGSVKCGCTCPAIMNVTCHTVEEAKEFNVQYQSVHVGHDMEVEKLRLSKNERSNLASLLYVGMPMAKILDKAREEYSPTKRFGLITRKDLHNICRNKRLIMGVNQKKKSKIEKDPILPSLHSICNNSEMDATLTKVKDLERCIRKLKSVDQVRNANELITALLKHLNSFVTNDKPSKFTSCVT